MSYVHVEDSDPPGGSFTGRAGQDGTRRGSGGGVAHSVWRCYSCKSMCVTLKGDRPPDRCSMCGR